MYKINKDLIQELFLASFNAAMKAGETVMDVFNSDNDQITVKSDNSIISIADQLAHNVIEDLLSPTRIPIISEEGRNIEYEERKSWDILWLIDPLDGTRQFIQKRKEFTINIALLVNNYPVMGLIYAPALSELYFACKGDGAYRLIVKNYNTTKCTFQELVERSSMLPLKTMKENAESFVILTSPHHINIETKNYIKEKRALYKQLVVRNVGSSLKMCLLACGEANVYPRHDSTYEWDTAAAQAILEEAGCSIKSLETGEPLTYNKESLLNPCFVCTSKV